MANIYITKDTHTPGHVHGIDARGHRVDSSAGPRHEVIRIYLSSGHHVFDDATGRELSWDDAVEPHVALESTLIRSQAKLDEGDDSSKADAVVDILRALVVLGEDAGIDVARIMAAFSEGELRTRRRACSQCRV